MFLGSADMPANMRSDKPFCHRLYAFPLKLAVHLFFHLFSHSLLHPIKEHLSSPEPPHSRCLLKFQSSELYKHSCVTPAAPKNISVAFGCKGVTNHDCNPFFCETMLLLASEALFSQSRQRWGIVQVPAVSCSHRR